MSVTFEVFAPQSFNGWLKLVAPRNMFAIVVTFETSQLPIAPLNFDALWNALVRFVVPVRSIASGAVTLSCVAPWK